MVRVDAPVLQPAGGAYRDRAQVLVVSNPTLGATLHVRRNGGTAPTYTGAVAIPLLQDAAMDAWATKSGQADSNVVSASYTFDACTTFEQAMQLDFLTYEGGVLSGSRWFKVSAVSGDTLSVSVTSDRGGVGVEVYDAQRNLLATSPATDATTNSIAYDVTSDGTIYFRLFQSQGALVVAGRSPVSFTLAVSSAPTGHAISPVFAPVAGTYAAPLSVFLLSPTGGATMYYTTDGSDPTLTSTVYSSPIVLTRSTTIKAMAVKSGLLASRVSTASYVITGTIAGRVTDSQGVNVAGANVSLDYDFGSLFPGGTASAVTAIDGSYTITGVPPGQYAITATHPQYLAKTETVTVTSATTVQRDIVLEWTMVRASNILYKGWERPGMGQFVVGAAGKILHSGDNGTTWDTMTSGVQGDLTAVWGCATTPDVYAVGNNGVILHYGGTGVAWERMTFNGTEDLYGIFGFDKSNIYVVGGHGCVLHYDGVAWTRMSDNALGGGALISVWGTSPTDLHVVGDFGKMVHYDGAKWTAFPRLTPNMLFAVYGFDTTHVYAVGGGADLSPVPPTSRGATPRSEWEGITKHEILRFDGTSWSVVKDELGPRLMTIWGTSPADMYVAGSDGKAFQFDGTNLVDLNSPTLGWILSIFGSTPGSFYAVGQNGVKLRYSGGSWSVLSGQDVQSLLGIWAASATEIFTVGEKVTTHEGLILHSVDGGDNWTEMPFPSAPPPFPLPTSIVRVWGTDSSHVWTAGVLGSIAFWNGASWTWQVPPHFGGANLLCIRGSGNQDVYAVGDNGTVLRFNGVTWTPMAQPPGMAGKSLYAVCAFSNGPLSQVFVGGQDGQVFSSADSGATWTPMLTSPRAGTNIHDIFGLSPTELYAVGTGSTCLYYHSGVWRSIDLEPGTSRSFYGVWGLGAAGMFDQVICVGHFVIYQYVNAVWRRMATGTQEPFVGVWGALVDPLDPSKGLRAYTCTIGAAIYRHVTDH